MILFEKGRTLIPAYNPRQAEILFNYPIEPEWFILGGTGYGIEAQCVKAHWPHIKILACEPVAETVAWQRANGFPANDILLNVALWDGVGAIPFQVSGQQSSAVRDLKIDPTWVPCTTLDLLDEEHGPIHNAILWLDVERAEDHVLWGAQRLFDERRVLVVNVEVHTLDEEGLRIKRNIDAFLGQHNFRFGKKHQYQRTHFDCLYLYRSVGN